MTEEQITFLRWYQRMVEAGKRLTEMQALSLEAWIKAGEKRSTWFGWQGLIGSRPEYGKKPMASSARDERRRERA